MLPSTPAKWKESKRTADIVEPHLLVEAMESLRISGSLLRVVWSAALPYNADEIVRTVREGRMKSFGYIPEKITDIRWNVEFEWVSRGQPRKTPVISSSDSADASAAALDVAQQKLINTTSILRTLKTKNPSIPLSTSFSSLGQLEAMVSIPDKYAQAVSRKITGQTQSITRFLDIARKGATTPVSVANTLISTATNIVNSANTWRDQVSQVPPEMLSTKTNISSLLRAANYFADVHSANVEIAKRATEMKSRFKAPRGRVGGLRQENADSYSNSADGTFLAVHTVRKGDTPISLSVYYYKTPDHVVDILKTNRLPWTQTDLTEGTHLIIPKLADTALVGGRS
jgi:hypothetical protein